MARVILILVAVLMACGPRSPKDCRKQGEGVMRALIHEFESVETRADLTEREERLQRLYVELAEVMLRAERASQKWVESPEAEINDALNERLRAELVRVYKIPGAREIVEAAQGEALYRLDRAIQSSPQMVSRGSPGLRRL